MKPSWQRQVRAMDVYRWRGKKGVTLAKLWLSDLKNYLTNPSIANAVPLF
jgi:hypothetical protein